MTTRIRLPPFSRSRRITGAHKFYVQLEGATGVCQPLIRRQNLPVSTTGHGKVQRIQGPERRVHSSDPLPGLHKIPVFDCRDLIQCMGHVGTEEVLNPLGIFFRQFAPPHFLCQRRVHLHVCQPANDGRSKSTKPLLHPSAEWLGAVVRRQNACVDVLGQYRFSSR